MLRLDLSVKVYVMGCLVCDQHYLISVPGSFAQESTFTAELYLAFGEEFGLLILKAMRFRVDPVRLPLCMVPTHMQLRAQNLHLYSVQSNHDNAGYFENYDWRMLPNSDSEVEESD